MAYEKKDFSHLLGTPGFSDELLKDHFTLYEGYIKNTNTLAEKLATGGLAGPEYAELKRRFGWEFNGMRLHELYFGNMSKEPTTLEKESALMKKMASTFGSGEACHDDFVNVGAMRGIGWAVLVYDKTGDRLFNIWVNEHDAGHLAGAVPVVVMDVFEHAYVRDYGLKRADYIKAFVSAIDWQEAEKRFYGA